MSKIYEALATALSAKHNCEETGNVTGARRWADRVIRICSDYLPSGSGVDNGAPIDWDASKPDKLVFLLAYHHMNDAGFYDGWTYHSAIVTPSFVFGFHIRMTGRDRNGIKEYLAETLASALGAEAPTWEVLDAS